MHTAAHPSDLAAALAARVAMKSGRPVAQKPADRPLLWSAQGQADRLANSFGPEVEVVATKAADGSTSYEFRKAAQVVAVAA